MAVGTGRHGLIAVRQGKAVNTRAVALGLFPVAFGANNWFRQDIIVRMFCADIGMATGTGIGFMN